MTSIMTNTAAMAALQTLRSIDDNMQTTQARISSGYKVANASDNAAYWSIATTMRSDNKALATVQDALGLAASKADTAYTGLQSSVDVISSIKSKLVAAREPGVDKNKINKEIAELKNQLQSIAESASFSGENWLYNASTAAPGTKEMVGSFNRASDGTVSVTTLKYDSSSSTLIDTNDVSRGILTKGTVATWASGTTTTTGTYYLLKVGSATTATGTLIEISSTTTNANLDGMISAVDTMLQTLTDSASTLGAITSRIQLQDSFVKNLSDTIDKGVGRLVDADMNEESTKIKALQTQQQLGIQSLSIANTNAQTILTLFK
ncbi:flagellin N-terminal helical domain-containing protein [Allorhizobium terrae]|uniref:Flagellin n=1 Tax=Allorhizobium terrae TaxID=1848972 RepID=A0A4S3ZY37_9HYPH|nr:flagellin [Allorhizobium terrae]THF50835.1 flagellin [Allorhizobium terrae]TWD55419.1 flagellin [Agrobacterium vitis]